MSEEIFLGRFEVYYKPSDLYITSEIKLQFGTRHLDCAPKFSTLSGWPGNHWVTRGKSLCLRLSIDVNNRPLEYKDYDSLMTGICQLDLWNCLGVVVSLPYDADILDLIETQHLDLIIHFDRDAAESPEIRTPKICTIGNSADLTPPEKIVCVDLEIIHINISITRDRPDDTCSYVSEPVISPADSQSSIALSQSSEYASNDFWDLLSNESQDFQQDQGDSITLFDIPNEVAIRNNTLDEGLLVDCLMGCENILHIAFLGTFRLRTGCWILDKQLKSSICEAVPSIFNPTHRKEMAARIPLIDCIARSLTDSWQIRVRSDKLREKLSRLGNNLPLNHWEVVELDRSTGIIDTQSRLQVSLWKIMSEQIRMPIPKLKLASKVEGTNVRSQAKYSTAAFINTINQVDETPHSSNDCAGEVWIQGVNTVIVDTSLADASSTTLCKPENEHQISDAEDIVDLKTGLLPRHNQSHIMTSIGSSSSGIGHVSGIDVDFDVYSEHKVYYVPSGVGNKQMADCGSLNDMALLDADTSHEETEDLAGSDCLWFQPDSSEFGDIIMEEGHF